MEARDVATYLRQHGITVFSAAHDVHRPGALVIWLSGSTGHHEDARDIAASMPGVGHATLDEPQPGGSRCILRVS